MVNSNGIVDSADYTIGRDDLGQIASGNVLPIVIIIIISEPAINVALILMVAGACLQPRRMRYKVSKIRAHLRLVENRLGAFQKLLQ
jgi:hypothetical protein